MTIRMIARARYFIAGMDRWERVSAAFIGVLLIVVVVFMFLWSNQLSQWKSWCAGQGGIVETSTNTSVGVGYKGQPVTTVDSTYYCLTTDGRIIDILS